MRTKFRWLTVASALVSSAACSFLVDTERLTSGMATDASDDGVTLDAATFADGQVTDANSVSDGTGLDAIADASVEAGTVLFFAGYDHAGDEYWGPFIAAGEGVAVSGTFNQGVDLGSGVVMTSTDGARRAFFASMNATGNASGGTVYGPPSGAGAGSAYPAGYQRAASGVSFHAVGYSKNLLLGDASIAGDEGDAVIIPLLGFPSPYFLAGPGSQQIESTADYLGLDLAVSGINTGSMKAFGQTFDAGAGGDAASPRSLFVAHASVQNPWLKQFGDRIESSRVAVDKQGNIIVAGTFNGDLDFGKGVMTCNGDRDVFVAKLDPLGAPIWSKRFGNALYQFVTAVTVDPSNYIILGGGFTGAIDFGQGELVATGAYDTFVAKLDGSGEPVWSKGFGGNANDFLRNLAVDANGNVVAIGECSGGMDLGGAPQCGATGLVDAFVVKLDSSGNNLWHRVFGGSKTRFMTSLAITPSGAVWVGGHHNGSIDFGGVGLDASDASTGYDLFLVKLGP